MHSGSTNVTLRAIGTSTIYLVGKASSYQKRRKFVHLICNEKFLLFYDLYQKS